ncbi:MAG: TetR/AcrR family transcriptional regulator [Deltaproteobacteria bacterium]|nr:TetR/AcrR family transcriptional regulator [Deltaproteobacteria bacterium]
MSDDARRLESVAPPQQARSEETLWRILDAAEELIAEKGLADASIPEIVRRAGSSVGGFYARFRDKNGLLRALEERFFLDLGRRLDALADPARWRRAPVTAIVAACAEEVVTVVRARHHLITAFLYRGIQDPDFRRDALRFRRRVSERVSALLLGRRAEFAHPQPELAIDLGVQAALALMLQDAVYGETRAAGRALGRPALVRELTRSFLAYLGVDGALRFDPATR